MTDLPKLIIAEMNTNDLASVDGAIAVFATPDGKLDQAGRKVNAATKRAVLRAVESDAFEKVKTGEAMVLNYPAGVVASKVIVVKMARRPNVQGARRGEGEWSD